MSVLVPRPRLATLLTAAVVTTAVALTLAGCGSSGTTTAPAAGGTQVGQGGAGGPGRQPGVSGLIAAISGKTLQVQGTDGQTAVSYTSATTITDVATASAAALKAGLCANVQNPSDGSSATPSGQVTATSVTLSDAVSGRCAGGFGGGRRPSGAPSGAPSTSATAAPSTRPSGALGGRGGFGFGVNGLVSSVSGATFVVQSNRPDASGAMVPTKITVTTTDKTAWLQVKPATSKAIVVGRCALAIGKASDTGAVAATSLRISKATNGTCSTGRGQGRPNGAGGAGTGQPGNGQGNG